MSTVEERLRAHARHHPEMTADVEEVLQELRVDQQDRIRYGLSPITIHNDLTLPRGFARTRYTNVRFKTGPALNDYIEARMPTTRDQGWVEISTGDFSAKPTIQLRGDMLMLRAVRGEI